MKIHVQIKPGKKATSITKTPKGLIINLKSKPIKNAANTELIQLLSNHYKIPKTHIKILRGSNIPHKTIEIDTI